MYIYKMNFKKYSSETEEGGLEWIVLNTSWKPFENFDKITGFSLDESVKETAEKNIDDLNAKFSLLSVENFHTFFNSPPYNLSEISSYGVILTSAGRILYDRSKVDINELTNFINGKRVSGGETKNWQAFMNLTKNIGFNIQQNNIKLVESNREELARSFNGILIDTDLGTYDLGISEFDIIMDMNGKCVYNSSAIDTNELRNFINKKNTAVLDFKREERERHSQQKPEYNLDLLEPNLSKIDFDDKDKFITVSDNKIFDLRKDKNLAKYKLFIIYNLLTVYSNEKIKPGENFFYNYEGKIAFDRSVFSRDEVAHIENMLEKHLHEHLAFADEEYLQNMESFNQEYLEHTLEKIIDKKVKEYGLKKDNNLDRFIEAAKKQKIIITENYFLRNVCIINNVAWFKEEYYTLLDDKQGESTKLAETVTKYDLRPGKKNNSYESLAYANDYDFAKINYVVSLHMLYNIEKFSEGKNRFENFFNVFEMIFNIFLQDLYKGDVKSKNKIYTNYNANKQEIKEVVKNGLYNAFVKNNPYRDYSDLRKKPYFKYIKDFAQKQIFSLLG